MVGSAGNWVSAVTTSAAFAGRWVASGVIAPVNALVRRVADQSLESKPPPLVDEFSSVFETKTYDEWVEIFKGEPLLWWCPVNTLEQALADPQLHAANCFTEVPDGGTTSMFPSTPIDFEDTGIEHRGMAPEAGQHTDEVLAELGRTPEQIASLRKSGAIA